MDESFLLFDIAASRHVNREYRVTSLVLNIEEQAVVISKW